jgi:predicted aspartyl protease
LNNLTFLLDTGTSRTLLDARITKRLHLEGVAHTLTVFDREVEARLVVLPDLQLGAIQTVAPQVIAMDLSGVAQRSGFYADAILGMDILRRSSFSIDYHSKRIWFDSREPIGPDLSLDRKSQPYLIVFARIDGLPVRLMIDTGCETGMLFANRLPGGLKKDYVQMSRGLTVAGESPLTQIVSVRLAVGGSPAHRVIFRVVETGNNDMGYDGIVGVRALHASRIDFNFERMTIGWK